MEELTKNRSNNLTDTRKPKIYCKTSSNNNTQMRLRFESKQKSK